MRNTMPPAFKVIGQPIVVAEKARTVEALRISWAQRQDEAELHLDLRRWTLCEDGTETPHRGGLYLSRAEAVKLRDALNAIEL